MAKVLADFYYRWVRNRIRESFTADGTISGVKEWIEVDTTTAPIELIFPDIAANDILNGKQIHIIDQGNAATNNITLKPNPSDGTSINGFPSEVISIDNLTKVYQLVDSVWILMNFRGFNNQTAVSSTYTALFSDSTILGDTSGGAFTVNIPTAIGAKGIRFLIKKVFGAAPQLTIDPFSTQTIDGLTTVNLTGSGGPFIEIESDGANWFRIG